ncbi:MAG: hypothetical protein IJC51_05275, partial [Eggerthellaceae bacterium]|nr:hypothetical protein [Eggerthellaceae bacterium]
MSSDSRQKEKPAGKAWQRILPILFFVVVGAAFGFLVALYADTQLAADAGFLDLVLSLVGLLVPLAVAIVLQTIIHEAGHLVFGLVSGYRFSSFRIGSFMWMKTDEGI